MNGKEEPPTQYQTAILWAFQQTVWRRRTPDGKAWKPKQIIQALWELYDERPKGPGYKQQFKDEYYQRIFRLRSGITKTYIQDQLLLRLIEAFVCKFGEPEVARPPYKMVRLVLDAARKIEEFSSGTVTAAPDTYWSGWETAQFEHEGILLFRLSDERSRGVPPPEEGFAIAVLTEKYLALKPPLKHEDRPLLAWPAVFFEENRLYLELGFYIPCIGVALLRSITESGMGIDIHHRPGVPHTKATVMRRTMRMLDIRLLFQSCVPEEGHEAMVWEKDLYFTGPKAQPYQYVASRQWRCESMDFAKKALNFLDIQKR